MIQLTKGKSGRVLTTYKSQFASIFLTFRTNILHFQRIYNIYVTFFENAKCLCETLEIYCKQAFTCCYDYSRIGNPLSAVKPYTQNLEKCELKLCKLKCKILFKKTCLMKTFCLNTRIKDMIYERLTPSEYLLFSLCLSLYETRLSM